MHLGTARIAHWALRIAHWAVRQAAAGGQAAQAAELRQLLKRTARKAHRAASELRGRAHEELMRSDPTAFFRPFNKAAKAMSAIPSDTLVRYFCGLLGGDQPAEEPPPPEPRQSHRRWLRWRSRPSSRAGRRMRLQPHRNPPLTRARRHAPRALQHALRICVPAAAAAAQPQPRAAHSRQQRQRQRPAPAAAAMGAAHQTARH